MNLGGGGDPVSARLAKVGQEWGHGRALNLERIEEVLARLGRPHERLGPILHVAGTNGKGSTCAFLRSISEAAGLRAHVFTSPHLVRPNERVRVAGELATDMALIDAIDCVAATGLDVTYFEVLTAAAFVLFAETPADVTILEVGLGGRLDATNVISNPAASVIAPVDLDHQHILGPDIPTIAREKAGILKPGAPAVIGRQKPEGLRTLEACAAERGAPLFRLGQEWTVHPEGGGFVFQSEARTLYAPPPGLAGAHQIDNAALAVAALCAWGDARITESAIRTGIANAQWPGRLQRLVSGRLVERAHAQGAEVWLDGAHNPHAALVAAAWIATQRRAPTEVALVTGVLTTKDAAGILAAFRGLVRTVSCVSIPGAPAAKPVADLVEAADAQGFQASAAANLDEAVETAARAVGAGGLVLILGSLYLAGAVLADGAPLA